MLKDKPNYFNLWNLFLNKTMFLKCLKFTKVKTQVFQKYINKITDNIFQNAHNNCVLDNEKYYIYWVNFMKYSLYSLNIMCMFNIYLFRLKTQIKIAVMF